jgi:hypothetical protein
MLLAANRHSPADILTRGRLDRTHERSLTELSSIS